MTESWKSLVKLRCAAAAGALWLIATAPTASAQQAARAASAAIPTPSEFHGFDIGERYIVTSAVVNYYRMLAESSPRVEYTEYGRSIQGRPLPLLMIGSERNLARKDEIRRGLQRLTQVTDPLPAAELERLVADLPAVVWILIVDTDEEAGVNVLQEVAHDLATREDADARGIREDVLVIMTPMTNPDSHARYVMWHGLYDVGGAATDPNAVENTAHWGMNTDGNAYGIDVNRDFGVFASPEMQALARMAVHWRPQFWLDIHSGPNVLFMPPFPRPFHPLWPDAAPKWWDALARQANDNFGQRGWTFSSREGYEGVTSPTFGLSWGMLGPGVTGFLYETFGGRPGKTTTFIRDDGSLATMRMAMDRHAVGTWSLLQVARDRRREVVSDAHDIVVGAVREARSAPHRTVILPASGEGVDPAKTERLVERLVLQGIEVRRVSQPFTVAAQGFMSLGQRHPREFPAGSYVVDLVQPNARLARALLDPSLSYADPQVEVPFRTRMPYYDSSWGNLAYPFGVPAFASADPVQAQGEMVQDGAALRSNAPAPRVLDRAEPAYAFLLPPGSEASYRTAIELMYEGYRVRVFNTAVRIGPITYDKGTFALIRQRNPESLPARIRDLAREHSAELVEVGGPFTDAGATFGDERRLLAVPNPRVAVVADWPVSQDHVFGGIRNTLESDFGFPFSPVMVSTLNRGDLSEYTVVVLPHAGMDVRGGPAFSAGYRGVLELDNLRRYVLGGGTVIAMKGAGDLLAADSVLGRDVRFEGYAQHTNGATLRAEWVKYDEPGAEIVTWRPGLDVIGMPMVGAGYDGGEFAAPGLYPVVLDVAEGGIARVYARYASDPGRILLDGYMFDSDRERLAGSPLVVVQPVGRGRVIYLAEDITFRGQWYGLSHLFLNSLIFGPLL